LKVDRNSLIAGQRIKTVPDMLRDLRRFDCFGAEPIEWRRREQLWSDHVDDLVKRGIIDRKDRRFYKANERTINSGRSRKSPVARRIPDQTAAAQALIEQMLKDGLVERYKDDDPPTYQTTTKGTRWL
jgi:predicted transcriptional regulator